MSNHKNKNPENEAGKPFLVPDIESPSAATSDPPGDAREAAPVSDELQNLRAEKQELLNTLQRRQADFDNYRKRVEKERQQDRHRGVELLIEKLLPVLDAFDRALASNEGESGSEYRKGFELIRRQIWDVLSKQGLERVESVGQDFNPHAHHAIESVETAEHREGTVIGELQPGYIFQGRILRPAMVRVAAAPGAKSAGRGDK